MFLHAQAHLRGRGRGEGEDWRTGREGDREREGERETGRESERQGGTERTKGRDTGCVLVISWKRSPKQHSKKLGHALQLCCMCTPLAHQ